MLSRIIQSCVFLRMDQAVMTMAYQHQHYEQGSHQCTTHTPKPILGNTTLAPRLAPAATTLVVRFPFVHLIAEVSTARLSPQTPSQPPPTAWKVPVGAQWRWWELPSCGDERDREKTAKRREKNPAHKAHHACIMPLCESCFTNAEKNRIKAGTWMRVRSDANVV